MQGFPCEQADFTSEALEIMSFFNVPLNLSLLFCSKELFIVCGTLYQANLFKILMCISLIYLH